MKRLGWLAATAALPLLLIFSQPALGQLGGGLGGEASSLSSSGTVQGIVRGRDFAHGILVIAAGPRTLHLHATPDQLTDFRVGDDVDVDYDDYAGVLWLSGGEGTVGGYGGGRGGGLGAGPGGEGNGNFAEEGTISGTVASVDTSRGLLRLNGTAGTRTLRAHPADLQDVIPGQFVTVTYERVGHAAWIEQIDEGAIGGEVGGGLGSGFP